MYQLPVMIEKDEDGYYAYCPALEGCHTQGDTYEEVLIHIREAISLYISTLSSVALQNYSITIQSDKS